MAASEVAAASPPPIAPFDLDRAVTRLLCLAANKRAARPRPAVASAGEIVAHLFRISDFPEPSPAWRAADQALKDFARELGDVDTMLRVYDAAVDEGHGYHAVGGVSASWDGCNGWWH